MMARSREANALVLSLIDEARNLLTDIDSKMEEMNSLLSTDEEIDADERRE